MGKGSLGLYRQHDNAGKKWLAVRNLTGKVMFSAGVVPQMNFTAMDKAASVVFACRPVFGACMHWSSRPLPPWRSWYQLG